MKFTSTIFLVAFLGLASANSIAGIANTKHNLTATGTGPNKQSTTDQICVFCHTPHAADTTAAVPLWNKRITTGATFQTYGSANSSTIDGEVLTVGSVSLACLSCHDGTQAMDNIINAPGSGGYDATGGGSTGLGYTWASGSNTLTGLPKVGPDLRDDHPIGIQYCGGGISGSGVTISGTCNDSDFKNASTGLSTANINGTQVFWVDQGGVGRQKTDIILYTRTFLAGVGPSVECASCHDPHIESKGSDNMNFMRVTTAGSAICLACHVK
jgi:predicted CXXCH cytochrome family protein